MSSPLDSDSEGPRAQLGKSCKLELTFSDWLTGKRGVLAVHDLMGSLSNSPVAVFQVGREYFGHSRIRYLG